MRINSITSALAVALYSAGSMYAAAGLAPTDEIHALQAPNLTQEQINEFQLSANNQTATGSMLENDGINVQVNSQRTKFVEEADITGEQVYVVRLKDKPTALYTGGINGLDGTHVETLRRDMGIDSLFEAGKPTTERIVKYTNYLQDKQQAAIAEMNRVVGTKEVRKQFTTAVNAYTVEMTQDEAKRVSQLPQVEFVHRAKTYELHTDAGPQKISADQVWTGATDQGVPFKGEGIIMGIIDTGINSDHPSFADIGGDGYDHTNPWGEGVYVGACAEAGNESLCNDKLIGIRSYDVITDAFDDMIPGFPAIGEDYQGHGSHVAGTAAGNVLNNVDFVLPEFTGQPADGSLVKEDMFNLSGVAPHANIISYQVCHGSNDSGYRGCPWESMIGGIEDAIQDGVDVINFSIGGQDSTSPWDDGVELGFLAAREAGINVAVAAGNGGQPTGAGEYFGYIDHASPWLASVAATTHDRVTKVETPLSYAGFANDEAGAPLGSEVPWWSESGRVGGSINDTEVTGVVVWAKDYADINGNKDWGGYCGTEFPAGTFDFYKDGTPIVGAASGDTNVIVVCQRNDLSDPNGIARTAKVANVKAGGADGFIMYNYRNGDSVPIVAYDLPSIHLTREQWDGEVTTYGAEGYRYGFADWIDHYSEKGHMITIGKTAIYNDHNEENGDWLAPFSSRGPSQSTPEMLIPQIAAPGVNIYAAYADEHPFVGNMGNTDYIAISGTSMASPHVAGAMALIRQAHPDWTPTEVQSALMLTADNVVRYRRLNEANGDEGEAFIYRAGAGRINVAEAIDTGLVMDETIENFKAANPNNGGQVHRLNIPQLVNFECKPTCQWTRTFKATKDGSWSVDHSDVLNWNFDVRQQSAQNGVNISATPSEFSLKAGETQTVVFEASIMDTQDWFSNAEVELHSDVILTEANGLSSEVHLPLAFKFSKNGMPARLRAVAHRNEGSFQFNDLELPALDNPYTRVYAPVKADVKTVALPKDDDGYFPWSSSSDASIPASFRIDEATHVEMIQVPAGAKRLMVESQGTLESGLEGNLDKGNALVYVGKDYNGNGEADPYEEILCVSNHIQYNNFCNINNPEEGTYWAVIYNPGKLLGQGPNWTERYPDLEDEVFSYAVAVVTDEVASNMSLHVEPTNGKDTVSATLGYDIPEMMEGDIYFSVLDFGTSEVNAGNVGKVAFKLERGVDDVHLDVTQTRARAGDIVPYTFEVQPNDTGADRAFTITANMPEGLQFGAEDIFTSNDEIVTDISVDGNVVTISGVQPDTAGVSPHYIQTTNVDDAMCRMPNFGNSNPGGYVDLEEFGFTPIFSGFNKGVDANGNPVGDNNILYREGVVLPVSAMFNGSYDSWHLYNNTDRLNINPQNSIQLRGTGVFDLWQQPFFWPFHLGFPYNSFPYESVGPLWRGVGLADMNTGTEMMSVPLVNNWSEKAGISLASTATGWGIIEVDNARTYAYGGRDFSAPGRPYIWEEKDDRYDYQVIFNVNTRHGKNEHELYYAYDNVDFGTQNGRGAIGLQGFTGPMYSRGPISGGFKGEEFAFDDLDSKLHDGLVICYDYYGPESSQFEVTIWTQVKRDAVGTDQVMTATSVVDGMADFEMSHTLATPSNIQLSAIADMEVNENESVDVNVYYADNSELTTVNAISVSGENVTGIVENHESGASITIVPAENFHGMTEVTVTVADVENPADKASTTFMLNVISDGIERGCTNSAASNYNPNANEDDGSCITPPGQEKKSGGSLGYLALMLLAMAGMRRRIK
ncbi:S8 family serine peptidase [Thalassotalea mangrovi]|uniref:GlyGly-CTERM sorting domain-containing protein n=1 Tax=Thalassotalea mangrovi TaxID=2572245 RepID=A0A4U1B461_9GAMM|nr:S8 family serine peptidase [Thalassotalea mangrovi]TKB44213.1 GlyGly-CTERM sorting domain-containing protein [Thalassotalea mangrovi]